MPASAVASSSYSAEEFLSDQNLVHADATVAEVFSMMFGFATEVIPALGPAAAGTITRTAVVGLSGAMRGCCTIRMESLAARTITSAMLGSELVDEGDESINDAVGELCNMLAGGWKNRVAELASKCSLAPPTVICGADYKVHMRGPEVNLSRSYKFDAHTFHFDLHFEVAS